MADTEFNAETRPVADGRFAVQERLGGGGMGKLYRALDRQSGRPVALKILDLAGRGPSNEEASRRLLRFRREARILETLRDCEQVPDLLGSDMDAAHPWIAMEFLEGRTLRALIDDRPGDMSLAHFLHLATELVQGLHGIHGHGILHRDLSPDNILVVRDEDRQVHVRFLDFGIGKPLGGEENPVTQMPTLMGKPQYIAPEQTRGDVAAGSDIYALGVILYEMLTGSLPIPVFSFAEAARLLRQEPIPLTAHTSSQRVPEELRSLIMACLSKTLGERPTLDELAECLEELRRRHESGEDLSTEFSRWEISRLDAGTTHTRTVLEPRIQVAHYRTEWLRHRDGRRETWLARDQKTGREVSLEIVAGEEEERSAFLSQLQPRRPLEHENIQNIYELGSTQEFAWCAAEHVGGGSLKDVLALGKALAPGQILQIGLGILEGLSFLHSKNMAHGFLVPSHVLLDEFDNVKLKAAGIRPGLSCHRPSGAEAAWQAPEVLLGAVAQPAADFYAFGCLLSAMITGESPFEGSDMAQAYHHANTEPASVLDLRPRFQPRELAKVVAWTLQKDVARRPRNTASLLKAFSRCFSRNPESRPEDESSVPTPVERDRRGGPHWLRWFWRPSSGA